MQRADRVRLSESTVKLRANERNIVAYYMLRVDVETCQILSQQLPTFLLFLDRRSVAQQCWIRLHSSSKIVGAMHAHYTWFTKAYGLLFPTMHCQHGHNKSQHCWPNNVGSCCVCLHIAWDGAHGSLDFSEKFRMSYV